MQRGVVASDGEAIDRKVGGADEIGCAAITNDQTNGAVGEITLNDELAEVFDSHITHGFGDFHITVAKQTDGGVVERDGGVVIPASLTAGTFELGGGEEAGGVVKTKLGSAAQSDRSEVSCAAGVEEGAAQAACDEGAPSVKGTGGQRAAEFQYATAVHRGGASIVIVGHEHHRATTTASGEGVHIKTAVGHTDDQIGGGGRSGSQIGEHVVVRHVAVDVERAATSAQAVGLACARTESGGIVAAVEAHSVGGRAEEGRAITNASQIDGLRINSVEGNNDAATGLACAIQAVATGKAKPGGGLRSTKAANNHIEG